MGNALKINLQPTVCNLCGGKVVFTSNAVIYGKPYGSGKCYLCTQCGAYVGTHAPRPHEAYGILANATMREGKKICHNIFDSMWHTRKERQDLYEKLAKEMGIPKEECHFGYFNLSQLQQAYTILINWRNKSNGFYGTGLYGRDQGRLRKTQSK